MVVRVVVVVVGVGVVVVAEEAVTTILQTYFVEGSVTES